MKISSVDTYCLRAALSQPFGFSQWTFTHRESMLVRIQTDDGLEGWGEAFGPAKLSAAAVRDCLAPLVLGRHPCASEAIWEYLYARTLDQGQKGAVLCGISAIDIALWDIKAKAAGLPLYRLLGGEETTSIPCYATGFYFGGQEPLEERFAREAREHLGAGFRAMKMKVGLGIQRDAELVAAVREAIGSGARLMIDANHAYNTTQALALGRLVERHNIHWFEEPVSPLDVEGYLELKMRLPIPLAGGECEFTRFGFEPWLRRRALDYAQPDLCACGGISEGIKIATVASLYGVHVTPHAWGTAIGQAAALHFYAARPRHPSTLTKEDKLIECDLTESPFRNTIATKPLRLQNGCWHLSQVPGLGIEVDPAAIERFRWE